MQKTVREPLTRSRFVFMGQLYGQKLFVTEYEDVELNFRQKKNQLADIAWIAFRGKQITGAESISD